MGLCVTFSAKLLETDVGTDVISAGSSVLRFTVSQGQEVVCREYILANSAHSSGVASFQDFLDFRSVFGGALILIQSNYN